MDVVLPRKMCFTVLPNMALTLLSSSEQ